MAVLNQARVDCDINFFEHFQNFLSKAIISNACESTRRF